MYRIFLTDDHPKRFDITDHHYGEDLSIRVLANGRDVGTTTYFTISDEPNGQPLYEQIVGTDFSVPSSVFTALAVDITHYFNIWAVSGSSRQLLVRGRLNMQASIIPVAGAIVDGEVSHGTDAAVARPNVNGSVAWTGSVFPDNFNSALDTLSLVAPATHASAPNVVAGDGEVRITITQVAHADGYRVRLDGGTPVEFTPAEVAAGSGVVAVPAVNGTSVVVSEQYWIDIPGGITATQGGSPITTPLRNYQVDFGPGTTVTPEATFTQTIALARTQRADGSWTVARTGGNLSLGQDETGAVYVVVPSGNAQITGLASRTVGGAQVDGVMRNITRGSTTGVLAFDGRIPDTVEANAEPDEIIVAPGDVLHVGVSADTIVGTDGYLDGIVPVWIVSQAPAAGQILGSAVDWAGETYSVDLGVRLAELSRVDTSTLPSLPDATETLAAIARYPAAYAAITSADPTSGYENFVPNGFNAAAGSGYAADNASRIVRAALMVVSDGPTYSLSDRLQAYASLVRIGLDCGLPIVDAADPPNPDGGHYQEYIIPTALALHAIGRQADIATLRDTLGGSLRQVLRITQAYADAQFVPHDDITRSAVHRRRTLPAQPGGAILRIPTVMGGPNNVHGDWRQSYLPVGTTVVRESDGATATITTTTKFPDIADSDVDLPIDAQPTPAFTAGDVITMRHPAGVFEVGDPAWTLRGSDLRPSYMTASGQNTYAWQERREGDAVTLLRALGLFPDSSDEWQALREWVALTMRDAWPAAEDWPDTIRVAAVSALYDMLYASIDAPAVPVDLTAAGGSLALPSDNNVRADADKRQVVLQSTDQDWVNILQAGTERTVFMITTVPLARLTANRSWGVWGAAESASRKAVWLFRGLELGTTSRRGKISFFIGNSSADSAVVDEERILIVAKRGDGTNTMSVDWYSLADGTLHRSGESINNFGVPRLGVGDRTVTGERSLDDIVNPYAPGDGNGWPGEIEAMGHVSGVIPDAVWQQIALGGDIVTDLQAAGGTINYLRLLDGTAAGLAPPASVPADTTLPMTVDGDQTLRPGSTIRRQSAASYLVPDRIDDGYVWGVLPGANTGTVRLSGIIAGRTGALQARVFYADNGAIVQDWTTVIADVTALSGTWQGEFTAPLMTNGQGHIDLRTTGEPDQIAHIRSRVGVGYKILIIGQSQTGIWSRSNALGDIADNSLYQSVSFAKWRNDADVQTDPQINWIGTEAQDGLMALVTQLRSYTAAPVMILTDAQQGSGPDELMDDRNAGRSWAELVQLTGRYGTDVSLVAMNWITQGWETWGTAGETLEALTLGTGPAWDALVADNGGSTAGLHNLSDLLDPGWGFVLSPGTRSSTSSYEPSRSDQKTAAQALGFTIGPSISDFEIGLDGVGGGPHQLSTGEGNRRFGMRLGEGVARALGLSTSQDPSFASATWGGNQSEIVIGVTLPNGGSLSSPAPTAVRSFEVDDGGAGTYADDTFTAAISGDNLVLSKTTGQWAPGTRVRYRAGGSLRPNGNALEESAIVESMLYETWAGDTLGLGLPITAGADGREWVSDAL